MEFGLGFADSQGLRFEATFLEIEKSEAAHIPIPPKVKARVSSSPSQAARHPQPRPCFRRRQTPRSAPAFEILRHANQSMGRYILPMPRLEILQQQKIRAYRRLFEFTKSQCQDCSKTDCACKDTICAHVEEQAKQRGISLPRTSHKLRFIGCHGCVVAPHLRETCTIYLCAPAQARSDFPALTYQRLKAICAKIDYKIMEAREKSDQSASTRA